MFDILWPYSENVRYSQTISYNLIHSQTMQDICKISSCHCTCIVSYCGRVLYIPVWSDDMRRLQVILSDCADVWIWAKECKKWIKMGHQAALGLIWIELIRYLLKTQSHDNLCRSISTQCISIANVYQMSILRECFWNISTYIKMYQQIHHDISWYHVACKEIQLVPASKWKTSWIILDNIASSPFSYPFRLV